MAALWLFVNPSHSVTSSIISLPQLIYLFYQTFKLMKEQLQLKNITKKKSQDAFFLKHRPNTTPTHSYLHCLNPKKTHNRASLSVLQLPVPNPKERKRRVNSLQLTPADLIVTENLKSSKNTQTVRSKSILSSCLSDRNAAKDSHKLFKHKKVTNSNSDLHQEQLCSSLALKQKLSVIQLQKEPAVVLEKSDVYGIMVWILLIRKFYAKQQKNNKENAGSNIKSLISYLQKIQKSKIESVKFTIERTSIEPELNKEQLIQVLNHFFKTPPSQIKSHKKDKNKAQEYHPVVTYPQVLNCLLQYQLKTAVQVVPNRQRECPDQHEDAVVETARFQQGGATEDSKRCKKLIQIPYIKRQPLNKSAIQESYLSSYNQSCQKSKELSKQMSKQISPLNSKSKQSLNPSLSPFSIMESSNSRSSLQPNESGTFIFTKSGKRNGSDQSSLGMLTLQGKSPRQVMQSQIYESMQRVGVNCHRKNNISFSLDNLELEPYSYFQQTVQSFQQVLKKIKKIQSSYFQKSDGLQQKGREEQPSEEINLFLEQLINYRLTMHSDGQGGQHYSYFVSWQDIEEVKEHNCKLMHFLVQSTYMRDFLLAIQGLKIDNSPYLYNNMKVFLHSGLKILNLSNNHLTSISDLLEQMSDNNSLQLLNISYNSFTDINPLIHKFKNMRQIHAKSNFIEVFPQANLRAEYLKIMDLSSNKLGKEESLCGLSELKSLQILNLLGNPLLQVKHWKNNWKNSIKLEIIYEIDNLYVMSDYGHQKDIAFSRCKKPTEQPNNLPKIRTFIDGKLI